MSDIYLASQSPRRKQLLEQLNISFTQFSVDADETLDTTQTAIENVERLALLKARKALTMGYSDKPILAADTIVVVDDVILGKPKDEADFSQMLRQLSGRTHQVITAVAVVYQQQEYVKAVTTEVTFKSLSQAEMSWYWQTDEPKDKAGGYGIQGLAGQFVTQIKGSYFAVVGLPLFETQQLLAQVNYHEQ